MPFLLFPIYFANKCSYVTNENNQNFLIRESNITYPTLKTSANFKKDEFIKIGNGYFSNNLGNLTIASHCSPTRPDLSPETQQ